ncbi:MAG: HAMP domain-containing protein, partial [Chloroflexota bacterium]
SGQEGIIETPDYRGVPVLAAYRTIPQTGWGFVAKEDLAEAFAPVNDLTRQVIFVTLLVLLAAGVTSVLLARALTQPLAQLVTSAQAVAVGNFTNGVPLDRADEIGQLASAFRAMIAAVRARSRAQDARRRTGTAQRHGA